MLETIYIYNIDEHILKDSYYQQKAAVIKNDCLSNWQKIECDVQQVCPLSPDPFNLYGNFIFCELEESPVGIAINGRVVNNFRYTKDTTLLAKEGLQKLFDLTSTKQSTQRKSNVLSS